MEAVGRRTVRGERVRRKKQSFFLISMFVTGIVTAPSLLAAGSALLAAVDAAMPKKAKGGGGDGGEPKEKLPSEVEQMLLTKLNALQSKFDAQVKSAEDAAVQKEQLNALLKKERLDRKDNVEYLQAELDKKKGELDALQIKYVALQEEKDAQARRLKAELEKAKDTIAQQGQRLETLSEEVSSRGDQLIELGQLKANAASDFDAKGNLSSEVEELRLKLHESSQHQKILAVADGREGGMDGERVLPLLLLETLRLHSAKPVLSEQVMIALQYVLSSDRHADAEVKPRCRP